MQKLLKFFLRCVKIFSFLFVIVFIICFSYVKISPKLKINTTNSIVLYDMNNELIFNDSNSKEWAKLSTISDYLIQATICTEDKNFYKHHGFDFFRILKATFINLKYGKTMQGASTITQQYAKNLFLNFDKTWKRKWDEMWYTMRIESDYSKDDILEGYLNTIYYGHGNYGIGKASSYYFNKNPSELSLAEASLLAGIPKAPTNYSPINNLKAAKKRQKLILNLMYKNKIITHAEMNEAYNQELIFVGQNKKKQLNSIMYYYDAVINELKTIKSIPTSFNDIKGIKVYTSFNPLAQQALEENINNNIDKSSSLEVASVMMNPNTGSIISLIGGKDYNKSTYNRATNSSRQVGSIMKPYLYYAALENGFTTSSAFTSQASTFNFNNNSTYSPINYNNKYGNKPISMAAALAYSDNIYAVKTHLFLGYDALINVARRVGITSKLEKIPSLPLGTNEINIIEMTGGYAAFANLGYKINPHFIEKIEDDDGNILYSSKNDKELVLNSSVVFILNNMLTTTYDPLFIDYNYPTAIALSSKLKHKYAIKSGTTDTDNWYIGFNNDIVCTIWLGYDDNRSTDASGHKIAQNIWFSSIEKVEDGKKDDSLWYKMPKNVSAMFVDPISGKPVNDKSGKKKLMYFLKGTEPNITDPVFDDDLSKEYAS